MSELSELTTRELMTRMPPVEDAPILEHLAKMGLRRFKAVYAIETPTLENKIVDHQGLMRKVGEQVSRTYQWQAPFFDEHHLHWFASRFDTDLAAKFRNLPIHKLWVPRQFHDFIHVMTLPTDVPDDEVMQESVDTFMQDDFLYQITNEAITLQERIDRSVPVPQLPGRVRVPLRAGIARPGEVIKSRFVNEGALERRRLEFIEEIEEKIATTPGLSLSVLSRLELLSSDSLADVLPIIRREMGERVAKTNSRRKARAVKLPIAPRLAA